MESDNPAAERHELSIRWRRFAAAFMRRLRPATMLPVSARLSRLRGRAARAPLEDIRQRIQLIRGRIAFPPSDLQIAAQRPSEGERRVEPPQPRVAETRAAARRPAVTVLDLRLQQEIERFLRVRLPRIQVYVTAAADRIARRVGADAVTARNAIYFRQGAFRPATPRGMALLAHEATHVAWSQGARPRARSLREEAAALTNERRYLTRRSSLPFAAPTSAAPPIVPEGAAAPPPTFVQTALTGRDAAESADTATPQWVRLPEADVRRLKADLYRLLLDKLRSEFERGA